MVIDEKYLMKCMKRDFKSEMGYAVSRQWEGKADTLYLEGTDWAVEIEWQKAAPEVLGLIVEHMRDLPKVGEAFRIKQGEEVTCLNFIEKRFGGTKMETDEDGNVLPRPPEIKRTPIMYQIFSVWQKLANKGCVMVSANTSGILMDGGRHTVWRNNGLYLEGKVSRAFVDGRIFPGEDEKAVAIQRLSENAWVE